MSVRQIYKRSFQLHRSMFFLDEFSCMRNTLSKYFLESLSSLALSSLPFQIYSFQENYLFKAEKEIEGDNLITRIACPLYDSSISPGKLLQFIADTDSSIIFLHHSCSSASKLHGKQRYYSGMPLHKSLSQESKHLFSISLDGRLHAWIINGLSWSCSSIRMIHRNNHASH